VEKLFLDLLNLSINASYIILAVILIRLLLKKAPRWIVCVLWGIAAIRLVCPFSIESIFSLIPSSQPVSPDIIYSQSPKINSGISDINNTVNPIITDTFTPNIGDSVNPLQVATYIASVIWIIGASAMLIYGIISYILLHRKMSGAVRYRDNILQCERVTSPFILGFLCPKIYIPFGMEEHTEIYVIAHEQAHLKRCDHWIKLLGFVLLAVYWFNPFVWAAYILLCRDIEVACDQRVIKDMDLSSRKLYAEALLKCCVNRRVISACPVAFGEVGIKERVKGVMSYKKPDFWIILAVVVTFATVTVCFLTNPQSEADDSSSIALIGGADGPQAVLCSTTEPTLHYAYDSPNEPLMPNIILYTESETFSFTYSLFSSYCPRGCYEINGNILTLKSDDGKFVYVFKASGENYVFDAESSSELPKYRYSADSEPVTPIPDRAVFEFVADAK